MWFLLYHSLAYSTFIIQIFAVPAEMSVLPASALSNLSARRTFETKQETLRIRPHLAQPRSLLPRQPMDLLDEVASFIQNSEHINTMASQPSQEYKYWLRQQLLFMWLRRGVHVRRDLEVYNPVHSGAGNGSADIVVDEQPGSALELLPYTRSQYDGIQNYCDRLISSLDYFDRPGLNQLGQASVRQGYVFGIVRDEEFLSAMQDWLGDPSFSNLGNAMVLFRVSVCPRFEHRFVVNRLSGRKYIFS